MKVSKSLRKLKLITRHSLVKGLKKNSYAFAKSLLNLTLGLTMLSGLLSSSLITLDAFISICLKKLRPPFMTPFMSVLKLSNLPLRSFLRMKLKSLKTFSLTLSQEYRRKYSLSTERKCVSMTSFFRSQGRVWVFSAYVSFPLLGARLSRVKDGDILRLKLYLTLRQVGLFLSLLFLSAGSPYSKGLLNRARLNI